MKMNKKLLQAAASAAIGYATGMLNPAYVIGLRKGYDIRKRARATRVRRIPSFSKAKRRGCSSWRLISARPPSP